MSTVEKSIDVNVPVRTAYDQWTRFEQFPEFMEGVEQVQQLDEKRLRWKAKIGGVTREWDAEIVQQEPDQSIAWRATTGTKNDGAVLFDADPMNTGLTHVRLRMEVEPEGAVEKAADALHVIDLRVKGDLERFKKIVEERGTDPGGWRGEVKPSGQVKEVNEGSAGLGGTTGGGALGNTHT